MNEKIDLEKLMLDFKYEFTKTNDMKKAVEDVLLKNVKDIEKFVDIEKTISNLLQSTAPSRTIQNIDDNCNIDEILENTLNQFEHTFEDKTKKVFKHFIECDKLMIVDETKVFAYIHSMLKMLNLHKLSIKKLTELDNQNIANTSLKIDEIVHPRINTFNDAKKYNDIPVNKLSCNLYEKFEEVPREINAMFEIVDTSLLKNIDKSLLVTLNNQQSVLNSSENIKDTHIFRSAQIYCFSSFNKEEETNLTKEQLAKYTNTILNDFFEYEYSSNLNRNHISKPTQHKTYFNKIPILEFQTPKKIKEHPIFC